MKRFILSLLIIIGIRESSFASGKISGGMSLGFQHDAGGFAKKPGVIADCQNNISFGGIFKFDMEFIFFRTGVEYSYPIEKGKIKEGTLGDIEYTKITFWEVPVYGGLYLKIRDYGSLYLGTGGSYILGTGYVEGTSKSKINAQLFGNGFLLGIESEIFNDMSLIMEWEYMSIISSPVASSSSYKDVCIDYGGSRYRIGFIYHFNRYE